MLQQRWKRFFLLEDHRDKLVDVHADDNEDDYDESFSISLHWKEDDCQDLVKKQSCSN